MGKGANSSAMRRRAPYGAADEQAEDHLTDREKQDTMSPTTTYVFTHPAKEDERRMMSHFSSLLLSGDWLSTSMELLLLGGLAAAAYCLPSEQVNVKKSMPLRHLALFFVAASLFRRVYNSYLEACYFAFPQHRTQPVREHQLKIIKDLCGRDLKQLQILVVHDRLTLVTSFALDVATYYAIPGFYPIPVTSAVTGVSIFERVVRLALNHYIMSFGMYWMHRACHMVPFMWNHIHAIHHFSHHPLSRTTYQDHWFDNFANQIIGHGFAQILLPLDHTTFFISRFFRIMESLEKHSGISCYLNLAHQTQRWLPFAQMPHHHDWHHEGHKSCNFTFSALGGVWDNVFGTRKAGRARMIDQTQTVWPDQADDKDKPRPQGFMDVPIVSVMPVLSVGIAAAVKLYMVGGVLLPFRV